MLLNNKICELKVEDGNELICVGIFDGASIKNNATVNGGFIGVSYFTLNGCYIQEEYFYGDVDYETLSNNDNYAVSVYNGDLFINHVDTELINNQPGYTLEALLEIYPLFTNKIHMVSTT